ncbi:MAG: ADP-ribosylation factor-like protein, partial [Candidatus Lokiarchaeota archaeon]
IIIMGLDNAGKTSIVLSLKGNKNLLSYYSLAPTKDRSIEKVEALGGQRFSIWDFGGQKIYRDDHLQNFENYIKKTEKIIYVIDVQDIERYDVSLDFLEQILIKFKKTHLGVNLSIFLHKYDPDLFSRHPELNDDKIEVLIQKIQKIISTLDSTLTYKVFKTSIYTIFSKTPVI